MNEPITIKKIVVFGAIIFVLYYMLLLYWRNEAAIEELKKQYEPWIWSREKNAALIWNRGLYMELYCEDGKVLHKEIN